MRYREWRDRPAGELAELEGVDREAADTVLRRAVRERPAGSWLDDGEIAELLGAYGIRSIGGEVASDAAAVSA